MAFPSIPTAGGGRILSAVHAAATTPRTFPSLTSLTKNAGDLIIALIAVYQSSVPGAVFGSWGGGLAEFMDLGAASNICFGGAWKISNGTETGTFTVAQAGTITGHAAMFLMSIEGNHASAAPEAGSYASGGASAADPASFGPSYGADDTLWISLCGSGETATGGAFAGINTPPTNYLNDQRSGISADVVGGMEAGIAFQQLNAASEDVGPWSVDVSNARNAAALIAVRPVPTVHTMAAFGASPNFYPDRRTLERRVW